MAVVQWGFFAAIAEFGYFYDMTIRYIYEPNHLLHHKAKVALAYISDGLRYGVSDFKFAACLMVSDHLNMFKVKYSEN